MTLKEAPLRPLEEQLRLLTLHIRANLQGLLIVAVPDAEAERALADETRRWLGGEASIAEVRLEPEPVERLSLSHHLSTLPRPSRPAAVFVFGLDELPAEARTSAINAMNWGRERLRHTGYTVVLFVRPPTPGELGNRAPDFFSWRSDVFHFALPHDLVEREHALARLRLFARADLGELSGRYREYVVDTCRWLDLRGVLQVRNIVRLPLDEVFVPPDVTTTVDDAPLSVPSPESEQAGSDGGTRLMRTVERRLPLGAALREAQRLIILGDPGSGKSTALRFLTVTYARGRTRVQERLGVEEDRLPVLVPLSAFAEARERDAATSIETFLPAYFNTQGLPDLTALFANALATGRVVLLLDGLDEMIDVRDRADVGHAIADFVAAYPEVRVVVSSRIAGFQAGLLPATFSVFTIAPLDDEGIKRFATQWARAFEAAGLDRPSELSVDATRRAERRAASLAEAATSHPGVRRLASNPLMLTLLALVHQQGTRLPNRRADLYRLCVEALAETWNLARSLSGRPIDVRLRGRWLDEDFVVRLLAPVAYWMHETQPIGMISAGDLTAKIADEFRTQDDVDAGEADALASDFVGLAREQMGLLTERAPGMFAFLHLTIQEYLAARFLSERRDSFARIRPRMHDPRWREVVRLTAGTLRGDHSATFVEQIISAHVVRERIPDRLPMLRPLPRGTRGRASAGGSNVDAYPRELLRLLLALLDVRLAADCIADAVTVPASLRRWTTTFVIDRWIDGTVNRYSWQRTLVSLGRDVARNEIHAALHRVLSDVRIGALRAGALEALDDVDPGPETTRLLCNALTAPVEYSERQAAVRRLAMVARADEEIREKLREIVSDPTRPADVRESAAETLGETGRLSDDEIEMFGRMLTDGTLAVGVRCGAANALAGIGARGEELASQLVAVARDRGENHLVRFQSAVAAARSADIGSAPFSAVLELLERADRVFDEDHAFVRQGVLYGFSRRATQNERLTGILLRILRELEEPPKLRAHAAEFLAGIMPEHREVQQAVLAMARDMAAPDEVRRHAVQGAGDIARHAPAAIEVLIERMLDTSEGRLTRTLAANRLSRLWRTDHRIIPILFACIDDPAIHDTALSLMLTILSGDGLREVERITGPIGDGGANA